MLGENNEVRILQLCKINLVKTKDEKLGERGCFLIYVLWDRKKQIKGTFLIQRWN